MGPSFVSWTYSYSSDVTKSSFAMKGIRPNYFVGLRIPVVDNPTFASVLSQVTDEIVSRNSEIKRILIRHEKMHLTLALAQIDDNSSEALNMAISCFQSSSSMLHSLLAHQNTLAFSGVNAFGKGDRRNVLWLEPASGPVSDSILSYSQQISSLFIASGIPSEPTDIFHGTIANKHRKNIIIKESDYLNLDHYFTTPLSLSFYEVDLLKIGSTDPDTGYYRSISKLRIDTTLTSTSFDQSSQAPTMIANTDDSK